MTTPSNNPAPDDGDRDTVQLLLARDARGLTRLLEQHGARVRAALRASFGGALSDSDLDDALSTASFRAWRKVATFDPSRGTLRAWFYVVCRNAAHELLRARRRAGLELRGDELEQVVGPADHAELLPEPPHAFTEALRACVAELPRLQRLVVEADLQSDFVVDADELAERLGTTRNSVYVSRSNARKALKQALLARGFPLPDGEELRS
ncbi:MAG: sigma-70 family RNA polymerase sigma factor [Planctomycetota bacterium]